MVGSFERFQSEALEALEEYYKVICKESDISGIVICGSGRRAQLVCCLFERFGLKNHILAFCEEFHITQKIKRDLPVLSYEECAEKFGTSVYYITGYHKGSIRKRFENRNEARTIESPGFISYLEEVASESFGLIEKREAFLPLCSRLQEFMESCQTMYTTKEGREKLEVVLSLLEDDASKKIVKDRVKLFTTGELGYLQMLHESRPIYFADEYYEKKSAGVFLDIGAYNGDSLKEYIKYKGADYGAVISIEPDYENFMKLNQYIMHERLQNCYAYMFATGKEKKIECFTSTGTGNASVGVGDDLMHVEALDDLFLEEDIALMKLDVEGAEMDTLIGAQKIIKKWKPNLAISIYHKPEDLFTIPMYVHEIVPEYKFKIRHHGYGNIYDTVLYASTK